MINILYNKKESGDLDFEIREYSTKVGYAEGKIEENNVFILDYIYIFPEYRENGLGEQLLCEIEKRVKELGVMRIEGNFIPQGISREKLRSFYVNRGYIISRGDIGKNL